jgi:Tfp pilus assembly protein PilO
MEKIDWDKKAVLREQILFGVVIIAIFFLFFKMVYVEKGKMIQIETTRLENLTLERDAIKKFEAVAPVPSLHAVAPSLNNPHYKALLSLSEGRTTNATEFLQLVTSARFLQSVKVSQVESSEKMATEGYKVIVYLLKLKGGFRDVVQYVAQLEALEAVIKLDEVSMKINESSASEVDLELKIDYYDLGAGV